MDTLCTILTALVPARSPETCQLVRVLAEHGGEFEAADMAARLSGFRNRQHMGRVLHAEGLPQLTELAGWLRVLRWVLEAGPQAHGPPMVRGEAAWCGMGHAQATGPLWRPSRGGGGGVSGPRRIATVRPQEESG